VHIKYESLFANVPSLLQACSNGTHLETQLNAAKWNRAPKADR